ncbi:DUF4192 domain-containing protein [Allokutzneria sp. NRRL B-24872]|uniref:DUF4192 domain-containing protein n=1 Tax=Allokutzneria sp. NRRL B-24872 TaxID=1137961 RepID=UPI000A36000A|nr:DUF4192 domain-containing protein [Allokutzneria sp. NRRL B-24872]
MSVHAKIHLYSIADLVAAVPHLLGFHPADSLVVLMFDRTTLDYRGAMRVDLPHERHAVELAEQLADTPGEPAAVSLIVVGGTCNGTLLPFARGIDDVAAVFVRTGAVVTHTIWAASTEAGASCRLYRDPMTPMTIADPGASPLAARMVFEGRVTYESRAALARSLECTVSATALTRRKRLLAQEIERFTGLMTADPRRAIRDGNRSLRRALTTVAEGVLPDDDAVMRLAALLANARFRDRATVVAVGPDAAAAEQLWQHMTREVPAPVRVFPATLLGLCAYLRGDGALAAIALDVAREAYPDYPLAALLDGVVSAGMPPAELRKLITQSRASAHH